MSVAVMAFAALVPCVSGQVRHPRPSAVAAKAGSHLPFEADLGAALAKAKATGKHVFWYVPTVPRSPMDRKPVVDLFMKAGFFSDPDLTALLDDFVLIAGEPGPETARKYDLVPFRFIEPGFLILDAEGEVQGRAHSVTTFSPAWLAGRLRRFLKSEEKLIARGPQDHAQWVRYLRHQRLFGRPQAAREELGGRAIDAAREPELAAQAALLALGTGDVERALQTLRGGRTARVRFLQAACTFLTGRQDEARKAWRAVTVAFPDDPIGWSAAAEAEGFGPIARGFWTWRDLPAIASDDPGTRMAAGEQHVPLLRRRSVAFLLAMQAESGGWEDSNYDFGGQDSLPNVYVATSALCAQALLAHRDVDAQRCDAAVARAVRYVLDPASMNPKDRDEWIWARAYQIELLAGLLDAPLTFRGWPKEKLRAELGRLVKDVLTRQRGDGSFRHEYANPFATAIVLVALDAGRRHGAAPPKDGTRRAVASLERCRTDRGAFSYSQAGRRGRARASVVGSAGRMPLCEVALLRWGRSDQDRLTRALGAAFEHHDQLESTRKYDDHANAHAYGGFFFWFDVRGRQYAFASLEADSGEWRRKQRELILQIPEIDGCFVDSHELGRCYGTAMALLCLDE